MKTIKKSKSALAAACLMSVSATSAFAANMGHGSSGGGNSLFDRLATVQEIQESIPQIQVRNLWNAILGMEIRNRYPSLIDYDAQSISITNPTNGVPYSDLDQVQANVRSVYRKLFPNGKAVIEAMLRDSNGNLYKQLPTEILTKGACRDDKGQKMDASIHGSTPGTICFSADRLSKKLRVSRLEAELTGLWAHEVSHLVGLNEVEAYTLQQIILLNFPQGGAAGEYARALTSQMVINPDRITDLVKGIDQGMSSARICRSIAPMSTWAESSIREVTNKGITMISVSAPSSLSLRSARKVDVVLALAEKIQNLSDYCAEENDEDKVAYWGDNTSESLRDRWQIDADGACLNTAHYCPQMDRTLDQVILRKIRYQDNATLKRELQEILELHTLTDSLN